MSGDPGITNVNEYDLVASADAFVDAIAALAERTEDFGHAGVLSYRFFADRKNGAACAIIVYADGKAWLEHHQMAYQWPEMDALQATVNLRRVMFLGARDQAVETAMANAGLSVPVVWHDTVAAGFDR